MSVREARLKFASVLASYLRGEIDKRELGRSVREAEPSGDQALEELRRSLRLFFHGNSDRTDSRRNDWEMLCQLIAFLKSDLQDPHEAIRTKPTPKPISGRRKLAAVGALLSVIVSGYLAVRFSRFWLLLPGLTFGWPETIRMCLADSRESALRPPPNPFYPFRDHAQWSQYEGLLKGENLPDFENLPEYSKPTPPWWVAILQMVLFVIVGPIWVIFVFVLPFFMPFALLTDSTARPQCSTPRAKE